MSASEAARSATVAGLKYDGAIAEIASTPRPSAWAASATASAIADAPTCTMSLRPCSRAGPTQASASEIRSATVSDSDSPVVPPMNTPSTPEAARWAASRGITPSMSLPAASNGVYVAAISSIMERLYQTLHPA